MKTTVVKILLVLAAVGLICCTYACKKEQQTCGTCTFNKYYSVNDSTYTEPLGEFCGQGYDDKRVYNIRYSSTINGQPTQVHEYNYCLVK